MRLSMRRIQPGAVFSSFLGILDIKLGMSSGARDD